MQEAIGYANGTREIVRVMELSSVGETICSPRGEEDQMIQVSRGMKDIKERRGEERRGEERRGEERRGEGASWSVPTYMVRS
jgi:hypothetical protein